MKLTRQQVYELIDGERDYQQSLGPIRTDGSEKSVGDYLTMLRVATQRADDNWYDYAGTDHALDFIRKIAGIAVRCMEDHGAPPRKSIKQTLGTI